MIKSVIFDMDGLMIDTERLSASCWARVFAEEGLPFSLDALCACRGMSAAMAYVHWQKQVGHAFDFYGMAKRKSAYLDEVLATEALPVKVGLRTLLAYLKKQNYTISLATSTKEARASAQLETAGLLHYFDACAFGSMVEHYKPAPDIFLLASKLLCRAPSECLVLEDSPNGIRAAAAAGAKPMMIPDLTPVTCDLRPLLFAEGVTLLDVIPVLERESSR